MYFKLELHLSRDNSMKHLIAVAQAVRKQVHSHGPSIAIPASLSIPGMHDTSSSSPQFFPLSHPGSAAQGNKSIHVSPPSVGSPVGPGDQEHMHLPSPVYRSVSKISPIFQEVLQVLSIILGTIIYTSTGWSCKFVVIIPIFFSACDLEGSFVLLA
jgi:hypothetical protein